MVVCNYLVMYPRFGASLTFIKVKQIFIRLAHRSNLKMDKVYLRTAEDGQKLNINFRYQNTSLSVDRDFNFCRNINEKVEDALSRIRTNIEKELSKKAKKGKRKSPAQVPESIPVVDVELLKEGSQISDVTFSELLNGNGIVDLKLKVLDNYFSISYNEPWITNLTLPNGILAGFLVYPSKLEMQFAERDCSQGTWFKAKKPPSGDLQRAQWTKCGDGFFYNSKNDDIDFFLKFVLTPGNSSGVLGPAVEKISKQEVQAGPGICPFETRHCFTQERLNGSAFRIVSYNILADLYADSDFTRTHLFPYCPSYALKVEYRRQLYLKELLGYNADIICLQEVDMKIFESDLKTVLETPELQFQGLIAQKGKCGEGIAMFYRSNRFELIENKAINIGDSIANMPELEELSKKIKHNEPLWQRICDRSTTLQITLLKSKENDKYLLLANTHLYFHPDADHIRLLQIGFAILYIEHYYKETLRNLNLTKDDEHRLAIIFCGDFNTVPECGIYKLMTEKFVDKDCVDWNSNEEQAVKDVTLSQPFEMKSACGTPPFTNYTPSFAACLDYIFYQSDRLDVQQVVPLPTEEELKTHIAIPSVVFPSDHIALVADLKFCENFKKL